MIKPSRAWADLMNVIQLADRPVSRERATALVEAFYQETLEQAAQRVEGVEYSEARHPKNDLYNSQTHAWEGGRNWAALELRSMKDGGY